MNNIIYLTSYRIPVKMESEKFGKITYTFKIYDSKGVEFRLCHLEDESIALWQGDNLIKFIYANFRAYERMVQAVYCQNIVSLDSIKGVFSDQNYYEHISR